MKNNSKFFFIVFYFVIYSVETFHNSKYYDFIDNDSKHIQLLERNSISMTFDNQTLGLNEKILYFGDKPRDHK